MKFPIKSERLSIRPFAKDDLPKYLAGINQAKKSQNEFDTFANFTEANFHNFLQTDPSTLHLQIFSHDDKNWLGTIEIYNIKRGPFLSANIDYLLLNQHWGKGYASEALKVVIPFTFLELGLHRIEATIDLNNEKSLKVIEGLKFEFEGIKRHAVRLKGIWKDLKVYSRLAE